ncbi:uncharacterized protein LOC124878391 [Girardinichthys multiradiatus]|uniref:uncharacterized protein LOC124878391 n=1 Tax=Girardinichthys multiradiatus TaxID=208333 RepID=UPI001FAD6523|nr:uncharacterized protein LOC124878391 [Girardinichthys multiradiatus]
MCILIELADAARSLTRRNDVVQLELVGENLNRHVTFTVTDDGNMILPAFEDFLDELVQSNADVPVDNNLEFVLQVVNDPAGGSKRKATGTLDCELINRCCKASINQFTLMRLRMNLPLFFLGHCFHTSTSTASRVFNNTLNVMYFRLCNIIRWPSRDQILISLPMCYRKNFKNCTSIIDCFEIFIERPKEMRARAQTYSQYKHHNTVKYLISITPQGVISFVSKGWGGRTSDKYVTEHSGYLDLLSPGDVVLADRGFNVAYSVGLVNAQLKIPAFTKGKAQLHPEEIESSRGLAAVGIHVERIIGLVRNKYTILQGTIPISLCCSASDGLTPLDKMVKVCCTLSNLCPPVVPPE